MNLRLTLHVLGGMLIALGAMLLVPIVFSLYYGDGEWLAFVVSSAITLAAGGMLFYQFRSKSMITLREGFAIVTFGWLGFACFGGLPYLFADSLSNPVDALFEAMAGFTTVGASVFENVEILPESVLFWRAFTQWLGGMGIIVLGVAILPLLGVGGMQLFEAEAPGLSTDRLSPRIEDTARLLWGVYALITLVGVLLLWLGEMGFFDSVCHTFTAVATGGFSTRNRSLGAFGTYSQVVVILLMFLGGANFSLHYYALRGKVGRYWSSDEFRWYIMLLVGPTLIIALLNWTESQNFLHAAFTVTSVLTTTGFATENYELWPMLAQGILFALMFIGACAGSTAGGLKVVRFGLLAHHALLQTIRLLHPRQVHALKLDHRPVSADIMQDVLSFTVLFLGVFVIGALLLTAVGVDLLTAFSGTIACLATVGPGLGEVGPTDNYAHLPWFAKIVLSLVMLLGRLEVSTVLVLLLRSFWRK